MVTKLKKYLLLDISLILIIGIIMVYSSSYIYAKEVIGSSTHFLFKQLAFLIIGSAFAFVVSKTKLAFWYKHIYKFNWIATFLLALTFSPLGINIKGSQRWLSIAGVSIQPGEFVKYTLLFTAVYYFQRFNKYSIEERAKKAWLLLSLWEF